MSVTVNWRQDAVVLLVSGEIDLSTAPRLEEAFNLALTNGPKTLIVDLTNVTFFSSAGITPLIATQEATRDRTKFRIVVANTAVFRSLKLTAVDHELSIFATLADALEGD